MESFTLNEKNKFLKKLHKSKNCNLSYRMTDWMLFVILLCYFAGDMKKKFRAIIFTGLTQCRPSKETEQGDRYKICYHMS